MKLKLLASCFILFAVLVGSPASSAQESFWRASNEQNAADIDHSAWQNLLDKYLQQSDTSGVTLVDYAALAKQAKPELQAYIDQLAAIDIRDYPRRQQFAYWVNLYNALTVKLVADNYPVKSIKKISEGWLPLGPWDDELLSVAGQALTLNDIEHEILRPIWQDHRIHFAVNCASIGCPNLQAQAFTASNTEALLESAAREYLASPRGWSLTGNKLRLSKIFDWYQQDFGNNEAQMLATISQYLSEGARDQLADFDGRISYHYDWSLNDAK
ncbi:MAG: DUF547 domain-containing protein [Gammaproteobacteria bacterium]|nr:DUF547 domain-containing protein [Gammaproteobacteria bacterium]